MTENAVVCGQFEDVMPQVPEYQTDSILDLSAPASDPGPQE